MADVYTTPTPVSTPLPKRRGTGEQRPDKSFPMWFTIDTGSGTSRCFTETDVKNFAFPQWKEQVPDCSVKGNCSLSGQACAQRNSCSGQYFPTLQEPRKLYSLGPKVSIKTRGAITRQPYTFPLPLDYGGHNPKIPLNLMPWEGVP